MNETKTLYRVSFDLDRPLVREYLPRVPSSRMMGEDSTIGRVCFADSIEHCLSAMPGNNWRHAFGIGQRLVAFPYTIDTDDFDLVTPEILDTEHLVPDAACTQEHWLLRPVTLKGILLRIDDFAWGNYYFAAEIHRDAVYNALRRHDIPLSVIDEFRTVPVFDLVNNVLNGDPRFWHIDNCFGDLIAEEAGIPNNILFDYLALTPVDDKECDFL